MQNISKFFLHNNKFFNFCLFLVPTPAPDDPTYYVTFIITNTYGQDIDLRTSLPSPFNTITIINGQTVRLAVKVPTQQDVRFEAIVRETGERITINDRKIYFMTPRDDSTEATVLQIPESPGICEKHLGIF